MELFLFIYLTFNYGRAVSQAACSLRFSCPTPPSYLTGMPASIFSILVTNLETFKMTQRKRKQINIACYIQAREWNSKQRLSKRISLNLENISACYDYRFFESSMTSPSEVIIKDFD